MTNENIMFSYSPGVPHRLLGGLASFYISLNWYLPNYKDAVSNLLREALVSYI